MAVVTQFPSSNAADVGAGLTNPTNVYADDGTYTTAAPAAKNTTLGTRYGTFGFDGVIPTDATITKVQLIYEWKCSTTGSIATARIRSSVVTTDGTNHDDATEPAADTTNTYDITAERSWVRADLLDGTFFVELHAIRGNSSTAVTFSFDYVKVEVTYTVPFKAEQKAFRFYEDGTEAGSTAIDTQNTNITRDLTGGDSNLLLRVMVEEDGGDTSGASTDDYHLYASFNTNAYYQIGAFAIIDSYAFSNFSANIYFYDTPDIAIGQSFTASSNGTLKSIVLKLRKTGLPTGNAVVRIYAHSGTFGTTSIPTGTALASSDNLDVSTLTTTETETTINFSGANQISLESGINYCFALEYTNDFLTSIAISADSTSPTHSGNGFKKSNSDPLWYEFTDKDIVFQINTLPKTDSFNSSNLTDGNATTNRLTGGTNSFVAGKISEDGEVDNLQITASNYTELLYALTLKAAELADGDTIDFKVYRNGAVVNTYTVTPRITISITAPSGTARSYGFVFGSFSLFALNTWRYLNEYFA